jgi:hypothetical protein
MPTIKILTSGDHWYNREDVIKNISMCQPDEDIIFDINGEAPSLYSLGIIDVLQREFFNNGLPHDKIVIQKWHNPVESIPFRKNICSDISHFIWMSNNYRFTTWDPCSKIFPLGFFVGRLTLERSVMLRDLCTFYPQQTLVSLMNQEFTIEKLMNPIIADPWFEIWMQELEFTKEIGKPYRDDFLLWWRNQSLSSITNHKVADQYNPDNNTNLDLVKHYGKFEIEIVAETCCRGNTFFPTEKTIRPISQGKPIMVYGPKSFMARLRKLGFVTWGDIWDESYDELEGVARWKAMRNSIGQAVSGQLWNHRLIKAKADLNREVLNYLIAKYKPQ